MIRKLKSGKYRIYSRKKDPKTNIDATPGHLDPCNCKKQENEIQYVKRR